MNLIKHKNSILLFFLLVIVSLSELTARDRSFLKRFIPKHSIGAEIGVWKGDFSSFLLRESQPKKLHLIDPWLFMPNYGWAMYGGQVAKSQDDMDKIYHNVCHQFAPYPQVEIHRLQASEASFLFAPSYFDWIYIDGDHTYEGVMTDLASYFPKVKKGGLIIGDDYGWPSVRQAVKDFCLMQSITNIEVLESQYIIRKTE